MSSLNVLANLMKVITFGTRKLFSFLINQKRLGFRRHMCYHHEVK